MDLNTNNDTAGPYSSGEKNIFRDNINSVVINWSSNFVLDDIRLISDSGCGDKK
jgi:hypothetical protein